MGIGKTPHLSFAGRLDGELGYNGAVPSRSRSLAEIHLAVFLFGFPGLFAKWLAWPPVLIVFGRVLLASLALGIVMGLGRRGLFRIASRKDAARLVLCGAILAAHWTMFFQSVRV